MSGSSGSANPRQRRAAHFLFGIRERMQKPTVSEVKAYVVEKNYNLDAESFWLFYEQKGWCVGRNKMQRWRAAVSLWARNGWGRTAVSNQEFARRNQDGKNYRDKIRLDYEDYLQGKTTQALQDILRDNGQIAHIASWLIREIIENRHK